MKFASTRLVAGDIKAMVGFYELVTGHRAEWLAPVFAEIVTPGATLAAGSFEVVARSSAGELPVERHPELSADRLLIAGTDASGAILAWSLTTDPRVVRAEVPGPDGRLTGRVVYRGSADLLALLPDASSIVQGAVYQPSWNGSEWSLTLVGTFAVDGAR